MKTTRGSGLVLAGALGLAGLGIGATFGPAAASAATSSTTQAVGDRVTAIKNALAGLVKDGTITQSQADKVATTLDGTLPRGAFGGHDGFGHRGLDLSTAASVIGVSEDSLRTSLQSGKTLAQVAQAKGISQATLVSKLVAAEKARLAAAVKAGHLTQAQADAMSADLTARVTERVTSTRGPGGPGFGHHRWGDHDGDGPMGAPGDTPPAPPVQPAPPTTPTPAPTT